MKYKRVKVQEIKPFKYEKQKKKFKIRYIFYAILILIFALWIIRAFAHTEIDDIHPDIPCEQEYIEKSDILWVVPHFHGKPINETQKWCKEILALNKTLGLHGLDHYYKEFKFNNFTKENLTLGIKFFKECFGYEPTLFKAPQLSINEHNKKLLENNNLELKHWFNQITHRVYHCDNDTTTNEFGGILPNGFYDYF